MRGQAAISPLAVELVHVSDDEVTVSCRVTGAEFFFAGHYPSMPILPGVLLIHLADQALRHHSRACLPYSVRIAEVASVKFLAPVLPPQDITVTCAVRKDGDHLRVTARAFTPERDVARMRLRCTADVG